MEMELPEDIFQIHLQLEQWWNYSGDSTHQGTYLVAYCRPLPRYLLNGDWHGEDKTRTTSGGCTPVVRARLCQRKFSAIGN